MYSSVIFAVHLLALQSKWENAAVPVYNYLWNRTTILGTDTILSFAKTYQPCLSTPCSCLQRMHRCWFNTHRSEIRIINRMQ